MTTEVTNKLKKLGVRAPKGRRAEPLWQGPESSDPNGGVTFSLLSRFLCCRERFRLHAVEGLQSIRQFNHRIEYGNMWHVCEEALAGTGAGVLGMLAPLKAEWESPLTVYCKQLMTQYPMQREQIDHWFRVCRTQFPLYVDYWSKHPDVIDRIPLLQEQVFSVLYILPSGRTVRLRGKWDSVDLIGGMGKDPGIWLQENKTKGDIREGRLKRQLSFDLQTMMYLVALSEKQDGDFWNKSNKRWRNLPLKGVRYNVVRRPLSGGKGSIVRHKATKNQPEETKDAYYSRLSSIIREDPACFFMRWKIEIFPADVAKFRRECLDPILEQLCEWWDWVSQEGDDRNLFAFGKHWRHPFGVWNTLDEGGSSDLDACLATSSEVGLTRVEHLFEELT